MQLTSFLLGALALPILASAQPVADTDADADSKIHPTALVKNECKHPVYLQSVPNDGGKPGRIIKLAGNGLGYHTEPMAGPGASIHLSRTRHMTHPLSFDYTPSGDRIYYDLGDQFGNPFLQQRNTLIPGKKSCYKFNCAPGEKKCYSNLGGGNPHIENCEKTDLTMTLCA